MTSLSQCPFCTLPEIKARMIIDNNLAWAFPTNIPITPGHTLVSPKRCVSKYEDLTEEERRDIEDLRLKICNALRKTFGAEGFNFAWNDGKAYGQSVPHFHLHIVPRTPGDTGITEYEPRKFLYRPGERESSSEEELTNVAALIRKGI